MSQYLSADAVVDRLDGARRSTGGWMAQCPAHDDDRASLRVSDGRKGTVLFCHAGCSFTDVCSALGIDRTDLFYDAGEHDWGHKDTDVNRAMRRLIERHSVPPFEEEVRLEDVMWQALVSDRLDEEVWGTTAAETWVMYREFATMPYPEAMQYVVIVGDGPLFTFLRPLWEVLGRPDWSQLKAMALKKMGQTYREMMA